MTIKNLLLVFSLTIITINAYSLRLTSDAFKPYHRIPDKYTCDGEDISPPISWTNIPAGTQSYALIVEDPDANNGVWDHWVLFNIPVSVSSIDENPKTLSKGIVVGKNSWGKNQYGGPCPPKGKHRYVFTLYALKETLDLPQGSSKKQLMAAIKPDMVAGKAKLIGVYKR